MVFTGGAEGANESEEPPKKKKKKKKHQQEEVEAETAAPAVVEAGVSC